METTTLEERTSPYPDIMSPLLEILSPESAEHALSLIISVHLFNTGQSAVWQQACTDYPVFTPEKLLGRFPADTYALDDKVQAVCTRLREGGWAELLHGKAPLDLVAVPIGQKHHFICTGNEATPDTLVYHACNERTLQVSDFELEG